MEWNLIEQADRNNYTTACKSMQARMDPGCKAIAAQNFRHTVQKYTEPVMDLILRLERIFRRAYGKDKMSAETKDTLYLLYGQLHAGLRYSLMKTPAVSGAKVYFELCGAAKSEERCQVELNKRQTYQRDETSKTSGNVNPRYSNAGIPTPSRQYFRRSQTRGELE